MKRLALIAAFAGLVAFAAVPAHAAGIALRWLSCEGVSNRNFACDKSTGAERDSGWVGRSAQFNSS